MQLKEEALFTLKFDGKPVINETDYKMLESLPEPILRAIKAQLAGSGT